MCKMCRFFKKLNRRDKEAQDLLGEALDILDSVWNDTGFDVYEECLDIADLTFRIKQFLQREGD